MAQFLYLFEAKDGLNAEAVSEAGCAGMLPKLVKTTTSSGPGGVRGVVAVNGGEKIGYYPDKQTWRRRSPGVWVGVWNDDLPTPEELAFSDQQEGHWVTLGDGRQWLCPMAREWLSDQETWASKVPAAMDLDENGNWIRGEIEHRFRRLWEIASFRWDLMCDKDSVVTTGRVLDMAVECLAVNYRIGRVEAAMLRLFDDQGKYSLPVLDAAVDMPTINAWMKKKERQPVDGLSSPVGGTA